MAAATSTSLPDQLASFAPVVKHAVRAQSVDSIPELLAQAWQIALTPPSGPVYVEIPVDLLKAPAGRARAPSAARPRDPRSEPPPSRYAPPPTGSVGRDGP